MDAWLGSAIGVNGSYTYFKSVPTLSMSTDDFVFRQQLSRLLAIVPNR